MQLEPDRSTAETNRARHKASCAVKWLTINSISEEQKRSPNKNKNMKKLFALLLATGLLGCTTEPPQQITVANTHYPYSRYSTSAEVTGPTNTPYATWSTARLQKRRTDLYAMTPLGQSRNGVPEYIYHGVPLRQQDEIKAIEAELNRRYQAGDRAARVESFWPESRRHIS
jgi:hypothetical protein